MIEFLKLVCATWFISTILINTAGPFGVFTKFRGSKKLGGLSSCIYCLSPYVAVAVFLGYQEGLENIVEIFAIAGGGLLLGAFSGASYQIGLPDYDS